MRASHVAVALCVLGALVPSAIAGIDAAPMFSEWFHAQKAGPSTRAKAMGGYEEAHTKHICLQETQQYNCRYVGCPDVLFNRDEMGCNPTGAACEHCRQGTVYQSDLTCCGSEHQYGYGDDDGNEGFGSGVAAPTLKIGTCDWDIDLYRDRRDQVEFRKKQIWPPSLQGADKIGTAWATCYLTAAAEYCGDVLCDKMVLSFKGGVYRAIVKSTLAEDLDTANPELSCLDEFAFNPSPEPVPVRRRANVTLTDGTAEIISGVVTITSLDRATEYSTGYMDYVAKFTPLAFDLAPDGDGKRTDGPPPPSLPAGQYPTVTPNTYNIKLVSSGSGPVSA